MATPANRSTAASGAVKGVVPAGLAALAGSGVLSGAAARERTLPLLPAFAELVPQGVVQRGSVVGCAGGAAVSLALALAAGPSAEGAWVGVVGLPTVGVAAAVELGIAPERLVLVAEPGGRAGERPVERFTDAQWADVLAAMIDGFDVVVVGPGAQQVRAATARRLVARLQARGALLITTGAGEIGAAPEVFGADLRFDTVAAAWQGLGVGHGVAQARCAEVQLSGRRVPRSRHAELWLPTADGQVCAAATFAPAAVPAAPVEESSVVSLRRTG